MGTTSESYRRKKKLTESQQKRLESIADRNETEYNKRRRQNKKDEINSL